MAEKEFIPEDPKFRVEKSKDELDREFQELQKADLQDQIHERQQKRVARQQRFSDHGVALASEEGQWKQKQARCNHRKGGDGPKGVIGGKGTDSQYSVIKHVFANGDLWVFCTRCKKAWKPPVLSAFKGKPEEYKKAMEEYQEACNFPTRNQTSTSYTFKWGESNNPRVPGGDEFYREVTKHTNLR
jgi:hypothetical protein